MGSIQARLDRDARRGRAVKLRQPRNVVEALVYWFRQNHEWRCFYCGLHLVKGTTVWQDNQRSWDHFVPRIRGGGGNLNLVPSCERCNGLKGEKLPSVFRVEFGCPFYAELLYLASESLPVPGNGAKM